MNAINVDKQMNMLISKLAETDCPRRISAELYNGVRPSLAARVSNSIADIRNAFSAEEIKSLSKKRSMQKIFASVDVPRRELLFRLYAAIVLFESVSAGVDSELLWE